MKMRSNQYTAMLLALVYFTGMNSAFANCDNRRCVTTVKRLYVHNRDRVWIQPADNPQGIVNCTLVENKYFTLYADHMRFKEIYAALLAATISKTIVILRINEGSNDCKIAYVVVEPG